MREYPINWKKIEIVEILAPLDNGNLLQQGWSPRCERFPSEGNNKWGVVKTTAVQEGAFLSEHNKQLPSHIDPRPNIEIKEGDILLTCAGPRSRCGVACLVKETRPKLMMSGKMYRFRTIGKFVNSKYLEAFLHTQEAKSEVDKMKTGISDSGLNLTHGRFKQLLVPLAPTNEQNRIVAKIEKLFSELDKGIASLKTAREQLKVYRQAILKQAFEGKLTEQWRQENADKLETADQLLARIQQEREARYQQQMNAWKEAVKRWEGAGKEGKKPTKPKKQKQLIENDNIKRAKLPALPKTWNYHRLGEYIQNIQSGKSFKCDEREPNVNEVGVAKVSAVTWGAYNEAESKTCMDPEKIKPDYFIKESDFLFSRANTIELVGACVIVKKVTKSIMLSDKTLRIDFVRGVNKEYMLQYLRSWTGRHEITSRSTGNQDSMRNIGQDRIKSICIPACSEKEMGTIVRLLDENLTNIDEQQHIIEDTLQKLEALRQSILKKAFSGKLVPQDPNDEPASVLLKRIAAEKAKQEKQAKAAAKTTKKKRKAHAK